MKNFSAHKRLGFALIEVLIAVTIASGAMIVIVGAANKSLVFARTSLKSYQASLATEEAIEAVKAARASSWNNISSLTALQQYGINWNGTNWEITGVPQETSLGFTRSVLVEDVYRDGNDDISPSGTLDPGTKKITITVTWTDRSTAKSQTIEMYLTNIL